MANKHHRIEACTPKQNLQRMCQIIKMSSFIATQKFYLCQVSDCLSFPQILHAKGCSFWTSHTQNTTLGWFKKLFQPLKSFCRSDKAKHKPVVSKISRIGKSSNTVSLLFRVSGRWVRPWFPTVIGPLHAMSSFYYYYYYYQNHSGFCFLGQTRAFMFQTSHNLRSGPQKQKGKKDSPIAGWTLRRD